MENDQGFWIETGGLELGDEVEDLVTGFKGRIVGFTQWYTGCAVASVQPYVDKDGKAAEHQGFDVTRLRWLSDPVAAANPQRVTGGPQPHPPTTR